MAELIFWTSLIFILYVYFGYPVLLVVWRRFAQHPVRKSYWEPAVTVVAPAVANAVYNAVGARVRTLPLTPDKVKAAMKA